MKILLVSYYFPPMGGAGVQRALKLAKYLPTFGVTPVVVSGFDPHYVQDASLTSELSNDLVVRRVTHTPLLTKLAATRRARRVSMPAAEVKASSAGLRNAFLGAWNALHYPDDKAGWARTACREARRLLRQEARRGVPFDLVFTTSPPASAHAIGERLSREFGLPWVADFRDLWTDNPAYLASRWRQVLDRRLEQRWLDRATGVVTVTESWQRLLAARRSHGASAAFIPNGYDEDDFAGLEHSSASPGVFTLVHTGTFYGPRDPSAFLEGVSLYLQGSREGHDALRVRLVGNMGDRFRAQIEAFGERHPNVLECIEYLPHRQAIAELVAADVLLLVVGGGRGAGVHGWLPGKIFEYLRVRKPILLLGDIDGDAAQLLHRHSRGWLVREGDAEGVAAALRSMLDLRCASASHSPGACPELGKPVACFERRELACQMADFMRECAEKHHRSRRAGHV
jgi:glycosyltransferase involved in cell wall biosynthesis